jgi:large subunit ribosomal protein L13
MKTFSAKPLEVSREWYVVDATDKIVGRLATEIALRLRGKHKPEFTPHVDTGDFVIVVNAEKIALTGKKMTQKTYFRHSGYPGGTTFTTVEQMLAKQPERVVELAVKGMLPKNTLGRQMFRKLNVYAGAQHPHAAQKPEVLEINVR